MMANPQQMGMVRTTNLALFIEHLSLTLSFYIHFTISNIFSPPRYSFLCFYRVAEV